MTLEIKRYPLDNSGLLPWNSADEYLLKQFAEYSRSDTEVLIINDSFGYLSVSLNLYNPTVYTDSFISNFSITKNCENNNCLSNIEIINSFDGLNKEYDFVLVKIPKALKYLEYIIDQIKNVISKKSLVIFSGMTKHISKNTRDILSSKLGYTDITRVYKKSIAFITKPDFIIPNNSCSDFSEIFDEDSGLKLFCLPNVFSSNHLDKGTRLLLKNINEINGKVIDLGSGAGPIGLYCKNKNPNIDLEMIDESYQSVLSSKKTIQSNGFDAKFVWNDGLKSYPGNYADYIISNPPFHSETSVNMNVGLRLFNEAKKTLKKNGVFILVFNKTLSYEPHLNKLFSSTCKLDENNQFVVFKCIK